MEGLIPYMFRAIKRKRARRQYRCLTLGASHVYGGGSPRYLMPPPPPPPPPPPQGKLGQEDDRRGAPHRRHRSVEDYSGRQYYFSPETYGDRPPHAARAGGSFRMLSACVTGA